jgi:hypothetical protein
MSIQKGNTVSFAILFVFFFFQRSYCQIKRATIDCNKYQLYSFHSNLKSELDKYITEYLKESDESFVIELEYKYREDTSYFLISSAVVNSYTKNPPNFFFVQKRIPVLVFTGIEKYVVFESDYLRCLQKVVSHLEQIREDAPTEDPNISRVFPLPTYNPLTWKLKFSSQVLVYKWTSTNGVEIRK